MQQQQHLLTLQVEALLNGLMVQIKNGKRMLVEQLLQEQFINVTKNHVAEIKIYGY